VPGRRGVLGGSGAWMADPSALARCSAGRWVRVKLNAVWHCHVNDICSPDPSVSFQGNVEFSMTWQALTEPRNGSDAPT
jgi:hypothetical protein